MPLAVAMALADIFGWQGGGGCDGGALVVILRTHRVPDGLFRKSQRGEPGRGPV